MNYKQGDKGEMVRRIQRALATAGLKVVVDGIFGPITTEAVKAYQKKCGLKADGIVGVLTLARLGLTWASLKKSRRTITEIIIHCTATVEGYNYDVDTIRRWHKARGFADIGYHYVVYLDGTVHDGRDVDTIGAHASGHNAHSIGVSYVGGIASDGHTAKDTRTELQKAALLSLLVDLRKLYPGAKILGHRDTSPDLNGNGTIEPCEWIKDCPCFDAKKEYSRLK